jgi:hypothetical protein
MTKTKYYIIAEKKMTHCQKVINIFLIFFSSISCLKVLLKLAKRKQKLLKKEVKILKQVGGREEAGGGEEGYL